MSRLNVPLVQRKENVVMNNDINIAGWERALRVVVGAVLLVLAVVGPQSAWGLVGVVPLITGAMGFCPLYQAFGVSGRSPKRRQFHAF
jgi:hypothetical protein